MRNPLRRRRIPALDLRESIARERRAREEYARSLGIPDEDMPYVTSMPVSRVDFVDKAPGGTSGVDGDSWYWQAIAGGPDINPELMGRMKYDVYREMKTDAAVRSLLLMWKLPLRSAHWMFEPASEEGIDELICDAAAWQFGLNDESGRLDLTWDEQLQQLLYALDYGAHGEELVWGDIETWVDAEGNIASEEGGRNIRPLNRLAPRYVTTVSDIEVDERTGQITRIKQDIRNADWIPADKLSWFALERENGSWWGASQLRAAYGPWLLKKGLLVASGLGWDRFAGGVPVVRYPLNGSAADKREAEQMGRNYRMHERAYVTLRGRPEDGWNFEVVGGAGTLMDPTPLLRHYDQQIAMNGLQQFSSLGTTETGSRAVGEVLSDPYYLAVQALAKGLIEHRKRGVLRRWVDVNFGTQYKVPNLSVSKIQGRNIAVLARALADLSAAGFSFTDRDTQNDVRDVLDLRHLPDGIAGIIDGLPEDIGINDQRVPEEGGSVLPNQPDRIAGGAPILPA